MNDILNTILKRRSIRKYRKDSVPEDTIKDLLRSAMSAPSACNQQPWQFVVVHEKTLLCKISEIHSGLSFLKDSPLLILVCGEPNATTLEYYWEQDCSAATENILIAAQEKGLGVVWLGINPKDDKEAKIISEILNIPKHIKPFSMISVGFPAEEKEPENRFSLAKIHYNNIW